ncbi:flavin reductase [Microbacterium sp. SORGH_AS_0888]|uniref:flavin reductase n=1 Tax=Microbacterium sp. SORGH_AS_0888 TaxID=3041791 RepID=UPI002782C62B|nr:flavin reductase [Microbacterium sp. SORGH_AS_0888]MDQ1128730.1 flavin reductase (DIM6/NTAB) family NADH-FMN oxidoreductase RutF [Microbacterium sp. SORGH_AS_0888]
MPGGRRIAIIGAGEAGAQLALGLHDEGYAVTLISERSAEQIRTGNILSSQCMFGSALAAQEDVAACADGAAGVEISGIRFAVPGLVEPWAASLDRPALSIDQRVKCAEWIERFVRDGGDFRIEHAGVPLLESLAAGYDLVVVATGKGELSQLFATDHGRSPFDRPQRVSAVTYVTAADEDAEPHRIRLSVLPGVGEFFTFPGLTVSGPCRMMVFEGVPGGPFDRWDDVSTPAEHLTRSMELLADHLPDEAERFVGARLTDEGATLRGRVTPTVRVPVGTLASGRSVFALGDAAVLNDPLTGQGSNNASIAAHHYLDAIVRRGDKPFDAEWMRRTFEDYWRGWGQWSTAWTNGMLQGLRPAQLRLIEAAESVPTLAQAIVAGFDDPRTLFPWWSDETAAAEFLAARESERDARFDLRDFRNALGQFATGVTVITTRAADGHLVGMTANSFASVSMDPPLVLWCPGKHVASLSDFTDATHFAINVLASSQHHLSRQFALPGTDKFAGVPIREGRAGVPVLEGALATFECRTVARHDAGDHVIYVGEVERYEYHPDDPLVFHGGAYHDTARHRSVTS